MTTSKRVAIGILILLIFFFGGILGGVRFLQGKRYEEHLRAYRLPKPLSQQEYNILLERLKMDPEISPYFTLLPKATISKISSEVFVALQTHATKDELYSVIQKILTEEAGYVRLLLSIPVPDDFLEHPERHPQLRELITKFYFTDFKLALLGMFYRSTYDPSFQFQWDAEARRMASIMNHIVIEAKRKGILLFP